MRMLGHPATADDFEPGLHKACFEGCGEPQESTFGMMIRWDFLAMKDNKPFNLSGLTSDSFNTDPRCKAYQWAKAIDPSLTDLSVAWDDKACVGKPCQIRLKHVSQGGFTFLRVEEVIPWASQPREPRSAATSKGRVKPAKASSGT